MDQMVNLSPVQFMYRSFGLHFALAVALSAASHWQRKEANLMCCRSPDGVSWVTIKQDSMKSYLALGDSYTTAEGAESNDCFPVQTVSLLNAASVQFSDPEVVAQTGWTTADLLAALDHRRNAKRSYDVVSLLIGVNNQFQARSREEYRLEFTSLLGKAVDLAGRRRSRVFVLSIPDYSVTPYGRQSGRAASISKEIDVFNEINKSISRSLGLHYLDVTTESRMAANDPGLVASDGLHFSAKEYLRWADMLSRQIKAALE